MQISLSHFTFKKTSLLFFARCREQKKITSRAKVNALVYSMICGRLFRAFTFDRDAASPRTELHAESKTFRGRAKHKTNASAPYACGLRLV
jgi:hypothetical protein